MTEPAPMIGRYTARLAAWTVAVPMRQALRLWDRYGQTADGYHGRYGFLSAARVLLLAPHFESARALVGGTIIRAYDRRQCTCPCTCHARGMAIDIRPGCSLETAVERLGGAVRARLLGDVRGATARPDLGTVHVCWRSTRELPGASFATIQKYQRNHLRVHQGGASPCNSKSTIG